MKTRTNSQQKFIRSIQHTYKQGRCAECTVHKRPKISWSTCNAYNKNPIIAFSLKLFVHYCAIIQMLLITDTFLLLSDTKNSDGSSQRSSAAALGAANLAHWRRFEAGIVRFGACCARINMSDILTNQE